jgi:hypothetical protein
LVCRFKPTAKSTAKPTAKSTASTTAKPAGKGVDTSTATTLKTEAVVPGKACKKGSIDPAGKYVCKLKKGSNPPAYLWTAKSSTTLNTEPKTTVDTSTAKE